MILGTGATLSDLLTAVREYPFTRDSRGKLGLNANQTHLPGVGGNGTDGHNTHRLAEASRREPHLPVTGCFSSAKGYPRR